MSNECQTFLFKKSSSQFMRKTESTTNERENYAVSKHDFLSIPKVSHFRNLNLYKPDFTINYSTHKDVIYNYEEIFKLPLPYELRYLIESYKKSEYILDLEDNWDDNGAVKYEIEVWKSALKFINEYARLIFLDFNKKLILPRIYHGPNGTIDILIENENYSLLINVAKTKKKAIYYGKDNYENISKGEINISRINGALIPLAFNF